MKTLIFGWIRERTCVRGQESSITSEWGKEQYWVWVKGSALTPGLDWSQLCLQPGFYAWLIWNTVPLIRADFLERQWHYRISRQLLMNGQRWEESMEKLAANNPPMNKVVIQQENVTETNNSNVQTIHFCIKWFHYLINKVHSGATLAAWCHISNIAVLQQKTLQVRTFQ